MQFCVEFFFHSEKVFPGGPAARSGLVMKGDLLHRLDYRTVSDMGMYVHTYIPGNICMNTYIHAFKNTNY